MNPCPTGWGIEPQLVVEVARLAVQTGCVTLYEVENGVRRVTKKIAKPKPVIEYLKHQARFRHLVDDEKALAAIQAGVDQVREELLAKMVA
jgi:pyruvate/2-oxoacid:ferredoxin oxidoreductase beta subunit